MQAALGALGLFLWVQPLPDSVALAQPLWLAKAAVSTPPEGPEVLAQRLVGDTLYVWARFWEGPGPVQWRWGSDTYLTLTFVPPLPPDSLMPLADFSVPPAANHENKAQGFAWERFGIAVALLLLMILLGPLAWKELRPMLYRLELTARWWLFLWRWRPKPAGDFRAFTRAVKELLRAYATFHPGALTPQEAQAMQGPPALRATLRRLLELEYAAEFAQQTYPPQQYLREWQAAWQALRQVAPTLRKPLPRLTL